MTRLKRFEPHEMFELVTAFAPQWQQVHKTEISASEYFVIPRYNACIRADKLSIEFFFSHIHRVWSLKSNIFKYLLRAACRLRRVRSLLVRRGLIDSVIETTPYRGTDWEQINVLFAEWHFVGAFSSSTGEVAHILGFPEYREKLERELAARSELSQAIRMPSLIQASNSEPAGWIEPIVGNKHGQHVTMASYQHAQEILLKAYETSSRSAKPQVYINYLTDSFEKKYEGEVQVRKIFNRLVLSAQSMIDDLPRDRRFTIARSHGDFKPSQIIMDKSELYIIDWTESAYTWILHDLVSLLMMSYDAYDLLEPSVPEDLNALYGGLQRELSGVPMQLPFIVTLMEIAVRQHVVFSRGRGPISSWKGAAEEILHQVDKTSRAAAESGDSKI